jgi:hypothetical protein
LGHSPLDPAFHERRPWNEARLLGAKRALFDFAIGSKLRGCDVVKVPISDVVSGGRVRDGGLSWKYVALAPAANKTRTRVRDGTRRTYAIGTEVQKLVS